jgi:hypothetical protein
MDEQNEQAPETVPDDSPASNTEGAARTPLPKPSIGRIVHYCSRGSMDGVYAPEQRVAIITEVHPFTCIDGPHDHEGETNNVSLAVFTPQGLFFDRLVPFSQIYKQGHWSWPPRV